MVFDSFFLKKIGMVVKYLGKKFDLVVNFI